MRIVNSIRGPFWVWDRDQVGQQLEAGTWWDQHIQAGLDKGLTIYGPERSAIDLGASVGWFTTYLAERFAWTVGVEAHPGTFELLRRNVEHHVPHRKTTLLNVAAYDRATLLRWTTSEEVGFPMDEHNLDGIVNPSSIALSPEFGAVTAFAMDPLIRTAKELGMPPVAVIKVDVQGSDLRALVGLEQTIRGDRPVIVYEHEPGPASWHGDGYAEYGQFFTGLDYVVHQPNTQALDYVAVPRELS